MDARKEQSGTIFMSRTSRACQRPDSNKSSILLICTMKISSSAWGGVGWGRSRGVNDKVFVPVV